MEDWRVWGRQTVVDDTRFALLNQLLTWTSPGSGNNVVSYFMPEMFESAGITNTNTQLLLNAINPIFSMIGAIYGASLLDKLGRRKMMLWGLAGSLFFYILLTAFAANANANANLGYGVIVSICMRNPFKYICTRSERYAQQLRSKLTNFGTNRLLRHILRMGFYSFADAVQRGMSGEPD